MNEAKTAAHFNSEIISAILALTEALELMKEPRFGISTWTAIIRGKLNRAVEHIDNADRAQ